ncbi:MULTISPECIES: ornithine carbamoyltransferase [Desulfosporosinus]|uniref:Ornithine carbamoyltransferase n=1 Tax=Desulfosporosinus lacus DSM 15449 TaxID=1121420 RepID=A0A1M6CHP2_9FIRM|nr:MULTISPECIES: ornithine carbamoyltransferase [Desulfosporosinus]MCO5388135.1 ornithine carbamoyltransferase [Desulfosporosinus sp.]MDA8221196.1 ornithine carbamoyltransferase [Desulfitobacterium hafniense]SHI60506.1 ornithine carbamoyltransferase [Desulfosporosinus lacus DSM 15449]
MKTIDKSLFKGRDFISLHDFNQDELSFILDVAKDLKAEQRAGRPHPILQGKTLGMVFTKSSTRTRVSFEVGMYQLGGHALFLSGRDIQLGRGEPISDTARVLSRMVDGIMIRTFSHQEVLELAEFSTIPIINGLTDLLHPCQVLADLMTIQEHKGRLEGLKLAYVGDGNNMAHSLMFGGAKMGLHVVIASPQGYKPDPLIIAKAQADAKDNGGLVEVVDDPSEAVKGADVLYTDVWASMGQEAEAKERMEAFKGYQINSDSLKRANQSAIVLHCLPAHRGEEITEDVIEGAQSVVFDEAENRLHAQKAIMALVMA